MTWHEVVLVLSIIVVVVAALRPFADKKTIIEKDIEKLKNDLSILENELKHVKSKLDELKTGCDKNTNNINKSYEKLTSWLMNLKDDI